MISTRKQAEREGATLGRGAGTGKPTANVAASAGYYAKHLAVPERWETVFKAAFGRAFRRAAASLRPTQEADPS